MSFHKFPKISINILGGTFLFLIFFISLLTFNFVLLTSNALAQDAIQCTPGDINLNRNLKFVNNNNIYLGTGKLNFSGGNDGLYAANDGGNLLLKSPMAISLQSGGDFKFQNSSGNSFAQFFTGSTPTLTGAGNLLVNGKIEGLGDVQGSKVCVTGGGTQCVSSWSGVNIAAHGESRCDGVNDGALGTCANVVATNNVTAGGNVVAEGNITTTVGDVIGKRLCIQGSTCISSWADVMNKAAGGIATTLNQMTFGAGTTLQMDPGSVLKVCDGGGNCSTGQGVSKIIAGSGITISSLPTTGNADTPATGIGDVMIGLNIATAGLTCVRIPFSDIHERWYPATDPDYGLNPDPMAGLHTDNPTGDPDLSPKRNIEIGCPAGYKITGVLGSPDPMINEYQDGKLVCCDVTY